MVPKPSPARPLAADSPGGRPITPWTPRRKKKLDAVVEEAGYFALAVAVVRRAVLDAQGARSFSDRDAFDRYMAQNCMSDAADWLTSKPVTGICPRCNKQKCNPRRFLTFEFLCDATGIPSNIIRNRLKLKIGETPHAL